jgi:hypothetical protein
MTERVMGYNDTQIECPLCNDVSFRVPVYEDQFTICETGRVVNRQDRLRRDHAGEKLERLRQNSVEAKKASGKDSGPFKLPQSRTL